MERSNLIWAQSGLPAAAPFSKTNLADTLNVNEEWLVVPISLGIRSLLPNTKHDTLSLGIDGRFCYARFDA